MSLRDFGADESADEMLAVNPDYQNLVELLGAARNDMVMRLAEASHETLRFVNDWPKLLQSIRAGNF